MILTDREIQIALQTDAISIDPAPDIAHFSSTSLDLTLDKQLTLFKDPKAGLNLCIDPSQAGYNHEEIMVRWSRFPRQGHKVDLPTKRTIQHEDTQTVYGRV